MENVAVVMGEVGDWERVGVRLGVPHSKQQELGEYFVNTDPDASWEKIATTLYIEGEEKGVAGIMARKYLPKRMQTSSLPKICHVNIDAHTHTLAYCLVILYCVCGYCITHVYHHPLA